MQIKFSKLVKSVVFRWLRANKTAAQDTAYALCNRQGNRYFLKKMGKKRKKMKKEI